MRARRGGPAPLLLFEADREAAEAETQRLAAELVQHDRMRVHEADLSPPDMAGQSCWAIETPSSLAAGTCSIDHLTMVALQEPRRPHKRGSMPGVRRPLR